MRTPPSETEAVLLLHGQPGGARDWQPVLAAVAGRIRAVAPHRPGWDGCSAAGGIEINGRAALAALDAAGIKRATVVGHSFGGGVAAWIAVHHPARVQRLILAAPAANTAALYTLDRVLALPLIGDVLGAATLAGTGLVLSLPPIRRTIAERVRIDPAYIGSVARTVFRPSVWRAFETEQRAMVRELPDLERELHRIRAPTVILAGTLDRVVPPAATRALTVQIPHARRVLLGRAGHLLPQLHAGRLAELILEDVDVPV